MNIGMCLQPIDPTFGGGDHRVSQTQTGHDIFLASASPHTHTHLDTHSHVCTKRQRENVNFHTLHYMKEYIESYKKHICANTCPYANTRKHTQHTTLLLGGLLDPYCPLVCLAFLCLSSSADAWGITCLPPQIQGQITLDQLPNLNH